MELKLYRNWKKETYTVGNLYVDGKLFCNTLEDKDRGLKKSDFLWKIKSKKVYGETAIPTGEYEILMDVVSLKYQAKEWYAKLCDGKMPRLKNVPGFDGILIHPGTTDLDTYGCILVGDNKKKGCVLNSRDTFSRLYVEMKKAYDLGEKIIIKII